MRAAAIKQLVLDASVVLAWCFEDEKSSYAEGILDLLSQDTGAIVPAVWPLEITNALLSALRKKRITQAQATGFLNRISGFHIEVEESLLSRTFETVFLQANASQLTSYDTSYVELALRKGLPLATLDEPLKKAAETLGITIAKV